MFESVDSEVGALEEGAAEGADEGVAEGSMVGALVGLKVGSSTKIPEGLLSPVATVVTMPVVGTTYCVTTTHDCGHYFESS